MLVPGWLGRYGPIIIPEYFEKQDEHDICAGIISYFKTYNRAPDDADDLVSIIGQEFRDIVHSVYLGSEEWDLDLASDTAVQFAQEQAAKIAVLESLADIQQGRLDLMMERLKLAMKVGQDIGDLGMDVEEDVDDWLLAAQISKVPTGLIHVDIALEGGLGIGELGTVMAPPNYGKSMALINIGYGAAGLMSRRNVVHFTNEMDVAVVCKRYAARQVFRFPNRSGDVMSFKDDFLRVAKMFMPGKVRVVRTSGTANVLRAQLDTLINSGFIPGLIIVDSADDVEPIRPRDNIYVEAGDVFKQLRQLGYDYGCPLWTSTQTNRGGVNKEIITMADVADSFKKAAKSDTMMAVCQTIEEERNDQCRLFMAKIRDGESRALIRAKYYKKQQAIISTGFGKMDVASVG
jgi:replicative DNA helicase